MQHIEIISYSLFEAILLARLIWVATRSNKVEGLSDKEKEIIRAARSPKSADTADCSKMSQKHFYTNYNDLLVSSVKCI